MPPHDNEIRINTEIGNPLAGTLTHSTTTGNTNERNLYTTDTLPTDGWIQDAFNNNWTTYVDANRVNINGIDTNTIHLDVDYLGHKVRLELDKILDRYFRNIYRTIQEHVRMDISEDEFIKLIEENKDE